MELVRRHQRELSARAPMALHPPQDPMDAAATARLADFRSSTGPTGSPQDFVQRQQSTQKRLPEQRRRGLLMRAYRFVLLV